MTIFFEVCFWESCFICLNYITHHIMSFIRPSCMYLNTIEVRRAICFVMMEDTVNTLMFLPGIHECVVFMNNTTVYDLPLRYIFLTGLVTSCTVAEGRRSGQEGLCFGTEDPPLELITVMSKVNAVTTVAIYW